MNFILHPYILKLDLAMLNYSNIIPSNKKMPLLLNVP